MASREEEFRPQMIEWITDEKYEDQTAVSAGNLPSGQEVPNWLENELHIRSNRNFRVLLVEDLGEYKVFIQVPDGKSGHDFNVWYAKFEDATLSEVRFPKHDYMFDWFIRMQETEKGVFNALEKMIKNREDLEHIVLQAESNIKEELLRFLATLKWICLQEDGNYPPPRKMGSMYTLAAYVLLEYGFKPFEIRRLLRFQTPQT